MAYLVLARKYRPQTLEDVLGQDHVTTTLRNAIAGDRVAHAYLFTGARGVGKTSSARILAKALNCVSGPTITPCNTCENCREITDGNSLDVFEIDAASNTGVDHVRDLQDGLRYMPGKSRFKIYIIDEVHMLSTAAFNALLKTLEEPPPHVRFIFATTEPHKIPVTILSRCQRFDFKRLSRARIVERLRHILDTEGVTYDAAALQVLAREAEGSMRDALSLTDQALSFGGGTLDEQTVTNALGIVDRAILNDAVRGILQGDAQQLLEIVEKIYDYGYDVRQFTRNLLEHFRHLLVVKVAQEPGRVVDLPAEDIAELQAQAEGQGSDRLHRLFGGLLKLGDDVGRSAHPRMVLEVGLIRLATLGPLKPVEELLGALRDMAGRRPPIAGGTGGYVPAAAASPLPPPPPPSFPVAAAPQVRPPAPPPPAPPPRGEPEAQRAAEPAALPPTTGSGEDFGAWLHRANSKLAAQLRSAEFRVEGHVLRIRLPKEQGFVMTLLQSTQRGELEAAVRGFLGSAGTAAIELIDRDAAPRAQAAPAAPPPRARRGESEAERNRKREAVDHPAVQQILKVFEGSSIMDVQLLAEPVAPVDEDIH